MKSNYLIIVPLLLLFAVPLAFPFAEPVTSKYKLDATGMVLEDFSSGVLDKSWWRFGNLKENIVVPDDPVIGPKVLFLSGTATNWYVGGRGMYVGKDASPYQGMEFWLLGNGLDSGKVKVEFYEDDNSNAQIEQDSQYMPLYDDKFEYEVNVDWTGWKKVQVPFSELKDVNPGIGNDVWDPFIVGNSSGLTQIQFVFNAASANGQVNTGLGTIKLYK